MHRKKMLILYNLWRKLSKFSTAQKRFTMLFLSYFVPKQILSFLFVSLCEINFSKIQTVSLVLNLFIVAEILCVLLLWHHHLPATEEKASWLVFSVKQMKEKQVVLSNIWYWACSEILSYSHATFSHLMEICLNVSKAVFCTWRLVFCTY